MDLKTLIPQVASGPCRSQAVRELVIYCQKIALVYLRGKAARGHLHPSILALPPEDLAVDCVADLFMQDECGSLIQIKTYFKSISYENASEEEILTHLRRLVFSRVNQGIFRVYNENDPGLGKILRNIKLAIHSLGNFVTIDRFGEHCIAPSMTETLEHLPPIDRHDLSSTLRSPSCRNETIPALLATLSHCLREQDAQSRIVPVMDVAFAIRAHYAGDVSESTEVHPEEHFVEGETKKMIAEACERVRREMHRQYVGRKKTVEHLFDSYFEVIQQNLEARIIGRDGETFSYYERLAAIVPEMTKEEYQRNHKSKLEYLARLAYDRAIKELKKTYHNHFVETYNCTSLHGTTII